MGYQTLTVAAVIAAMTTGSMAQIGNTGTLRYSQRVSNTGGGAFHWMSGTVGNGFGDFKSFCLERDESIGPNRDFYGIINDEAVRGGVNTDLGDPISNATKAV